MLAPLLVDTAKVDSWGDSFLLLHLGHSAFCSPYTRASNSWSHCWQMYSKIGMVLSPRINCPNSVAII